MPRTKSPPNLSDLDARAKTAPRVVTDTPDETLGTFARIQRDRCAQQAAELITKAERENRSLLPSERADLEDYLADGERWAFRYEDHTKRAESSRVRASVVREPLTYRLDANPSFFRDVYTSKTYGDEGAKGRLERHNRELASEFQARDNKRESERRNRGDTTEYEVRANPSRVAGQGGSFAPPLWLIDLFATAPRPERVISDLATQSYLPAGCQSVNLPRISTGTVTQANDDDSPVPGRDFTDAAVSSKVVTIAGIVDVSMQLLEQSPLGGAHLDRVLFKDLSSAYDAELERQVTVGGGENLNELLGILNVSEIGNIEYTSASPKAVEMYPKLGEVFGYVSDHRKLRAEAWIMRGGRWAWLATGEDEQKRPLAVPIDVQSPTPPLGPIGTLLGNTPVYLSESIPVNLGTGKNQDAVLALRPSDFYLWETRQPTLDVFTEVLSGSLEARLRLYDYSAFIGNRYPTGIAALTGIGLKVAENE